MNIRGRWPSDIGTLSQLQVTRRRRTLANENQTYDNCDCTNFTYTLSSTKPNVWIFGDSISQKNIGYYDYVEDLVSDQVELHYGSGGVDPASDGGCGSSFGTVACLSAWIGQNTTYDVISFNWGLHDIAPDLYTTVEENEYISNLMKMHSILKDHLATNGTIIWQSTTPVPPEAEHRTNDDVINFNNLASDTLTQYDDVVTNDLYSQFILACHTNASEVGYPDNSSCSLQQKTDVHMTDTGSAWHGKMVAMSILNALGL